jgi:hypothetical protein
MWRNHENKKGLSCLKPFASLWEHTGSNRGPSACKADALNQLSYAPFIYVNSQPKQAALKLPAVIGMNYHPSIFRSANIRDDWYSKKFKSPQT